MTIDEFEKAVTAQVAEFFVNWRANAKRLPENWPSEMPEGDWWDQFTSGIT